MTQTQLIKLCKKWQKRLRLEDWDINVRFAHQYEFSSLTSIGQCNILSTNKLATILILAKDECPDKPYDPEQTLVHELVHVHMDTIAAPENMNMLAVEQALHGIVHGLYHAKR